MTALVRRDFLRLRQHWTDIAQDMVLTTVPSDSSGERVLTPADICEAYGMTPLEYKQLLHLPEFRKLVKDFKKRADVMGDGNSITLRAQMLAAGLMEEVFLAAKNSPEPKDKLAAFKELAQVGLLNPATNGTAKQAQDQGTNGAAVASVTINVPNGIPGMEHIYNQEKVVGNG